VGPALDWAVWLAVNGDPGEACRTRKLIFTADRTYWQPSEDWSQVGPLIDQYRVSLIYAFEQYEALIGMTASEQHESPLVAACRAIVSANLGEVVSVPAELMKEISA
jgi:hypothetical protein